jgi:hypothetical protein
VRDRALFIESLAEDAKWVVTGKMFLVTHLHRQGVDPQ